MKKIHLAVYRSIVICAKKDFHQEKYDFTCMRKSYSLVNQMINKRIAVVHPSIELLNLWEDFHKVVKFIDDNFEWLNPLMEHITKKKLSLD